MTAFSDLLSVLAPGALPWISLADAVVKASLLLAFGACATLMLRRASASLRHLIWTLALVGALIVPALASTLPRWEVPLITVAPDAPSPPGRLAASPTPAPSVAPETRAVAVRSEGPDGGLDPFAAAQPSAVAAGDQPAAPVRWETIVMLIWLAGFLVIAGRLVLGLLAVNWMSRRTPVVTDAPWLPLARRLAADLGVSSRVRFLRSPQSTMPMAWGIVRPAILMPADADLWPLERLRIVLLHELAHVRRRDCLTHVLAQAACAVYWFNPLAWIAARHARAERERACDDLVLTSGTRSAEYAEELLQIARVTRAGRFPAMLAGATLAMAHRSQLEGRLLAILDPAIPRAGLTRAGAMAATLVCVCAITPLAAIQPWSDVTPAAPLHAAAVVMDPSVLQMPNLLAASTPVPALPPPPVVGPVEVAAAPAQPVVAQSDVAATTADVDDQRAEEAIEATVAEMQAAPAPSPQPVIASSPAAQASPGRRADPRTIAALTLALKDTDKEVRETAMHALVQMRDPSIFDPLIQALRDASPEVREQAAMGLAQLRDTRAVDPLIAALKDTNADVREHVVMALSQLRDPRALDGILAALKDAAADVRQQAAFALGQFRDRRALPALAGLLTDADDDVRQQAVFALGQLRDPAAIEGLTTALRDARPDVRGQAVFALGQIGDRRSVDPLNAALKDADADVRQQAAFALGQIRDPRAVEALLFALKDGDVEVREQAAFALGQLKDPRAIDGLTTALKDANASVRQQAAFALGQLAR